MKNAAIAFCLLTLANAGCWECCQLCQKKTVAAPAPVQAAAEAKPAKQTAVAPDQVNKQNAREMAENLRVEIDRDVK